MVGLDEDKKALRDRSRKIRALAHRQRMSVAGDHFHREFMAAKGPCVSGLAVACYWPMGTELDVRPLMHRLRAEQCEVLLPVAGSVGEILQFRRWQPGDRLQPGVFGTREPLASAEPAIPEIVVVPLLAFDRTGNRLGYGGGYYDLTLSHLRASGGVLAIGAAYDEQEADAVPTGPGDQKLDAVVTDSRYVKWKRE